MNEPLCFVCDVRSQFLGPSQWLERDCQRKAVRTNGYFCGQDLLSVQTL